MGDRGEFRCDLMVTMGLMIAAGVSLLGLTWDECRRRKDIGAAMLFLWVIGTFFFAGFINWTINARSLLPMAPAAGILVACRLERRRISPGLSCLGCLLPLLAAAAIAVLVIWADYTQANTARTAAGVIHREFASDHNSVWFEGHWGFQYYLQEAGHKPLNFDNLGFSAGDIVVIAMNNTNVILLEGELVATKKVLQFIPCPWLTTMHKICGAGFYSQQWGPVPFLFGRIPSEEYYVFEIKPVGEN